MDRLDLERYLEENGVEGELLFTGISVHTAKAAAERMDVDLSQIAKSLVFIADKEPVLVIVPGNEEVDLEKVKRVEGAEDCRLAEKEEVQEATGYSVGEVPPVGVPVPVIVDESVLEREEVYAGGGSDRYLLRISPEEIKRRSSASVEDVIKG